MAYVVPVVRESRILHVAAAAGNTAIAREAAVVEKRAAEQESCFCYRVALHGIGRFREMGGFTKTFKARNAVLFRAGHNQHQQKGSG